MSAILESLNRRAAGWSVMADTLKAQLDRARWTTFGLSISGALVATIASQLPDSQTGQSSIRIYVAIGGAALLGGATFISQRLLTTNETKAWVRARAASEALKREAFKFAARAAPYHDPATAETALNAEREKIESDIDDLIGHQVEPTRKSSAPLQYLTHDQYRESRVRDQALKFYRPRAQRYSEIAARLRKAEFVLALGATLTTVVAAAVGKAHLGGEIRFDLAALTAVLTTVAGAVLSHMEASRYDHLVTTYRATARRLEDADSGFEDKTDQEWSQFVNACEDIIAMENNSWLAKWTTDGKQAARAPRPSRAP